MVPRPRVLVLAGPTGVGKSQFLYEDLIPLLGSAELISADSMQVYRGMDIGTAKPTAAQLARIPHHLVNERSPDQQFTVADFVRRAEELVQEIHKRNAVAVVSGGTAFYLKQLVLGMTGAPPSDPAVRAEIEAECRLRGLEAVREELSRVDPAAEARIGRKDQYRIVRALEVYRISRKPLSSFQPSDRLRTDWNMECICLERPRNLLDSRLERRVQSMMGAGLGEEVEGLVRAGFGATSPGMRAIGYREFFDEHGTLKDWRHPATARKITQEIHTHSRQYAKRQMTFFRSIPGLSIVASRAPSDKEGGQAFPEAMSRIGDWLSRPSA